MIRGCDLGIFHLRLLYEFLQAGGRSCVLGHAWRRRWVLRVSCLLSSPVDGEKHRSNDEGCTNLRNTTAPEEASGEMHGLHLSSASQTRIGESTYVGTH